MRLQIRDLQYEPIDRETAQRVAEATADLIEFRPDALSLAFVDDAHIRTLNREFRNTDAATDVISFEAEQDGDELIGEIIISVETAQRQADAAGHSVTIETAWLIAHGVLHAAGMDDETEDQLAEMIALQREAMDRIGLEPAG